MNVKLESRLTKLEQMVPQAQAPVTRIILKGATPTATEQAAIAEAESLGHFVIVRSIITPDCRS